MSSTQFVFDAIGTQWVIDIYNPVPDKEELLKKIQTRINLFDKNYSRFREDSLVTKMSQKKGEYHLPDDAEALFDLYQKMYQISNGLVTPLIGDTLIQAGYDSNYSFQEKKLETPLKWEDSLDYKFPKLNIKKPAMLDLGAAGKGYLIDIIGQLLTEQGYTNFCVEAGGDMIYRQGKGELLRVGLEHPGNPNQVIGVVNLADQSICGSAGNRRRWGRFHHILNPKTLTSPEDILAVWAVAETTLLADGMTTCLFFVDPKVLEQEFNFEYLIVFADYSIDKSQNFPGELFYQN